MNEISENTEKSVEYPNLKPWEPGQSGNPGGRPKNPLKEYTRQKFAKMTDEEKEKFLKKISPETQWKMVEGNPPQDLNVGGQEENPVRIIEIKTDDNSV